MNTHPQHSETPRTDAAKLLLPAANSPSEYVAPIDLCRTLERESAALAGENERLRKALWPDCEMQQEPKNPTLWRYLDNAFKKQITFHSIGVNRMEDGGFHFYIHPQSVSGDTEDYLVWPDPFNWSDMLVNKKDSPPPDVEKFKAFLARSLLSPAPRKEGEEKA